MKNLFIVLVLACFLSACHSDSSNVIVTSVSLNKQKDLTTIEMQERVRIDSQVYKLVQQDDCVYLINPATNLVEKEIKSTDSDLAFIINILLIVILILVIIL
jgi:hypothetical protein